MSDDIERLSRQRQELWKAGANPSEINKITKKLENAYEERRLARARDGRSKKEIKDQARIESELERLTNR